MIKRFIEALAEVLDVDLERFNDLSDKELLAMLEEKQAQELATL